MTAAPPCVVMRGITKRFPGVLACDRIDLEVHPGEIHALLGENGAGKTTLMKTLYGLYQPDAGEIWVDSRRATIRSPRDAIRAGIGMVFQHFTLIPSLTVAENLALADPTAPTFVHRQALGSHIRELAARYRLRVEPDRPIWQLSVGEQQRVEILKLLYRRARILIFDEPTAVLTPQEVEPFLHGLQDLAAGGHAVIFITHKLPEALAVSQRITVLRHGRVVATPAPAHANPADLARAMIGRELPSPPGRRPTARGVVDLALTEVSAGDDRGRLALDRLSIEVQGGEIVGIAGVAGNGQQELAEVAVGLRRASAGAVHIRGVDVTNASPRAIGRRGVSYIPADRQGMGLVPSASVLDNLLLKVYRLPPIARGPLINYRAASAAARRLLAAFQVSAPRLDAPAGVLSGGNQQRLLLARELSLHPTLLVACSPTHGLDVGAVQTTHSLLLEQRQRGCAILLISEDLDELLALADRIAVMYKGRIVGSVRPEEADVGSLGLRMAGAQDPSVPSPVESRP
ncbi:MAG TPA: ABC transporter ATP-binding protein [Candidatus Tectomicrobia bacterium]|nr:ABC transporter ATP-binding protein [Candidatus Tectomicrobia bacterium]